MGISVLLQNSALETEVTDLHMIWNTLSISGFEKAKSRKHGLGELMLCPLEHVGAARWEILQHLHGICVVERNTTLVVVHKHAHLVWCCPSGQGQVPVIVPSRETPVPKLQTPWESVPAQFCAFVLPFPVQATVHHAHSPGRAAVNVYFPVTLTRAYSGRAQGTAGLIELKRVARSRAVIRRDEKAPPTRSDLDLSVADCPVNHHLSGGWQEKNRIYRRLVFRQHCALWITAVIDCGALWDIMNSV